LKPKAECPNDPAGIKKLESDLLPIIQNMPHAAQRIRAAEIINGFFKAMKPDRPTLH